MLIESTNNEKIKNLSRLLTDNRFRKNSGIFAVEGKQENQRAINFGQEAEEFFICESIFDEDFPKGKITLVSEKVYQKLAYRDTTEGIIAVAKTKNHELKDLRLPKNPLILVMENIEKPGNIGAMLRTCDAAKVDAVIIANPKTDLYNPNIVRSSVGCLFTNQIATGTTSEIIGCLKERNINFYCATLQNSTSYHTQDYTTPTALVVGTEATGLTEQWRKEATQNIIIPMQGEIDSMNVSVAAAILIFEAKRQRGF